MQIIYGLNKLKPLHKNSAVAIGVFDGMHIGHRKIIGELVSIARSKDLVSVVVTFDPHPLKVLCSSPNAPSLISVKHRLKLMAEMGVDMVLVVRFTRAFSRMEPQKFVEKVLVGKLLSKYILFGNNFYFGAGARGGADMLKIMAGQLGYRVKMIRPVMIGRKTVSSSLIREYIMSGNLKKAAKFLGRTVSVLGTVVSGARLARQLGYPTANVNPHHEVVPPSGVYAVIVKIDGRFKKGVLNIGVRPTFYSSRDKEPAIEVHIFGFNGWIYGKDIEVLFIEKMRDENEFKDADALIKQIKLDGILARKVLNVSI